jgi:hypothetical protein
MPRALGTWRRVELQSLKIRGLPILTLCLLLRNTTGAPHTGMTGAVRGQYLIRGPNSGSGFATDNLPDESCRYFSADQFPGR